VGIALGGADVGMAQEFFGGEDVGVRAFCEFPAPGVAEVMPGAGFGNVGFELGVTQGVFHGVQADGGHRLIGFAFLKEDVCLKIYQQVFMNWNFIYFFQFLF